jgi:hypothetical protein
MIAILGFVGVKCILTRSQPAKYELRLKQNSDANESEEP